MTKGTLDVETILKPATPLTHQQAHEIAERIQLTHAV